MEVDPKRLAGLVEQCKQRAGLFQARRREAVGGAMQVGAAQLACRVEAGVRDGDAELQRAMIRRA